MTIFLALTMKCEYISLFSISTKTEFWRVCQVFWSLEMSFLKWKMGWPICAIGQPKVGTLDRSVVLRFAVVKVSNGASSHWGRQVRHMLHCHSGLIYISKTKTFPQGILQHKNKDSHKDNHITSNLGPGQSFHRRGFKNVK